MLDTLKRRWSATPFQHEDLWLRSRASGPEDDEIWLIKPLTHVNRSGVAVRALIDSCGLDVPRDLLVVVDDVALDPGHARFRARGSAGGHNGLESVEAALGSRVYDRLRIGVGSVPPGTGLADWVLSEFDDPDHEDAVLESLPELAEAVELWLREGIESAMNRYNARLRPKE